MNKEMKQTIGGILIFLAVVAFFGLLCSPQIFKEIDQNGRNTEKATQIAGLFGTICLFSAIILLIAGLTFINKWIPLTLLVAWHLMEDSEEVEQET
jgi:hypothetical protein